MMQNLIQMIPEYLKFKVNYENDPQKAYQQIQQLLANGQMTQQQLNQLQKWGSEFQQLLNNFK